MYNTVQSLTKFCHFCVGTIKVENEQPKICSQFLIGQCSRGKKCKQIHHSMPYLWQYQFTSNPSSKWHKFDENDCENIEKYFCDVNFTAGELSMATKITPQSRYCVLSLSYSVLSTLLLRNK